VATRVFISFDYDHDADLKTLLVGQSKNEDSPFEISDWSIKVASAGWRQEARRRISASSSVAVICGHYTDTAAGVAEEVRIAQDLGRPYFMLAGRAAGVNKRPNSARSTDKLYKWTWENLKTLVLGGR
jgi:hypothetical protein